uniref:Uncharacterized protein n=1 Tax=Rhizophora mucronata TaxID=61149 RepID=A0A2P2N4L7_RHIMU
MIMPVYSQCKKLNLQERDCLHSFSVRRVRVPNRHTLEINKCLKGPLCDRNAWLYKKFYSDQEKA